MNNPLSRFPASWIPTLYIAEGLPYFAVNVLAVILYTRMGVGLKEMTFYTGFLYLPWVIKPFWSPFVDIFGTKRKWTLLMQFMIGICMAAIALALPFSFFFASTLAVFWLIAFFSATHDIAADGYYMLALTHHQQAAYVGLRNTFYRIASLIGQGGLVWLAGEMEERTGGNIPLSWMVVFGVLSFILLAIAIWDCAAMPVTETDKPSSNKGVSDIFKEFGATFVTFFQKKNIVTALLFILLYRLPEALMLKVSAPFMLAERELGGLAMSTKDIGIVNGTVGVVALLAGGIVGGICIAVKGLKYWLWPMALALTLPCGVYCWMAMAQPTGLFWVSVAVAFEQFGYGFGFTAFMLYLIYFSTGQFKTSHYAFCTAFMALGMMLPGMAAGWLYEVLASVSLFGTSGTQGYINFFWAVMVSSLFTYAACAMVKIDPSFGRKRGSDIHKK